MKKTNRDVEKKEDGGWLGGAKKERKREEQEEEIRRRRIVEVYKLLPIQTMNLVMTCRRRRAGVNKQFCSEGILREIYHIYFS